MPALVRKGDIGPVVAEIQARLVRAQMLPDSVLDRDPATAAFDDETDKAVRVFQQINGIVVDGIVGPETFRRLEEARWRLGDRVLVYTPGHLLAGEDVRELQSQLSHMGFACGRVDGVFGPATDAALREFQRGVGVRADGMCGPETFRALDRLTRRMGDGNAEMLREHDALAQTRSGVAGKIIVIDPAHEGLAEEALRWVDDIVARLEGRLAVLGTQVILTRPVRGQRSAFLDATTRARFANETNGDLFVSVHVDRAASDRPTGAAAFYFGDTATGRSSMAGRVAAERIHASICARTDLIDLRCHPAAWDMLRHTRMPAVALEIGYATHPGDCARLRDSSFRDTVAAAISTAIVEFYSPAS